MLTGTDHTTQVLLGRDRECLELDRLIDAVRTGRSGALVMHGEPGVGKTTLLSYARERASGCRVENVAASRSEQRLAYAALHQLFLPFSDRLGRLPEPQRVALSAAFGLSESIPPDRFFVGLAMLALLSDAAEEQPLVCLIDDAQWLDPASSEVLAFVARRLPAESIAVVFAASEPLPDLSGLPEHRVDGLSDSEARTLLTSTLPGPLDERVAERILAEADGNPLALLDLPSGPTRARLAGGFGTPDAGLVAGRGDASFERRLALLPKDARRLLLVASAEPFGEPVLLWRAVEQLGIPVSAAEAAEAAGLLEIGRRVRFCHPVVRSAVYRAAPPADRREAHDALAQATDAQSDPVRHAWHRAYAALAPDEGLAGDLERSARPAAERGGAAAAAALLTQAAVLTPDPAGRARRALAAAEAERQAGEPVAALQLLASAQTGPLDGCDRARAELMRARIAFTSGDEGAAERLFSAARRLEPLDIDLAREAYLDALGAIVHCGPREGCDPVHVARAAIDAKRPGTPRSTDLLLDGVALALTEGHEVAVPTLRQALAAIETEGIAANVGISQGWLACYMASVLWEHDIPHTLAAQQVRHARRAGALATLSLTLTQLAAARVRMGELREAGALLREVRALSHVNASGPAAHIATMIAAYQGHEAEGRRLVEDAMRHQAPAARGLGVAIGQLSCLVLDNGLGRYDEALEAGRAALDEPEPVGSPSWALPELVEAAARTGAMDVAAEALRRLSERAHISGDDWVLGLEARSRALLSRGPEAEGLYRQAIARLATAGSRLDLARAHLLYGEWLRREGRRVDAREQLRAAVGMLGEMGVEAFAERARRELRATGETARKRTIETSDDLTAQEHEIAQLAREGLSNPEIGARLFLSPRTIEWHLRKIFQKLGITSRWDLRDALSEPTAMSA